MSVFVKNGLVFHPVKRELVPMDIFVEEGKIRKIGEGITSKGAEIIIDASGKVVLPGFIDIHVHARDLDLGYKETFTSATKAAVHGGVTTILTMPNTKPPINEPSILESYKLRAASQSYCNVGFIAGYNHDHEKLDAMLGKGVLGVKIYQETFLDTPRATRSETLSKAVYHVLLSGARLFVHPGIAHDREDDALEFLARVQEEDEAPLVAHSNVHSGQMEATGMEEILEITSRVIEKEGNPLGGRQQDEKLQQARQDTDGQPLKLHFCHVSSREGLATIKRWLGIITDPGMDLVDLTLEATPHHMFLDNEMTFPRPSRAKVLQPLRSREDRRAILAAVKEGTIPIIASDHAPHSASEKDQAFIETPSGFPVLDIYVPLLLTRGLDEGIPLARLVSACCEEPARICEVERQKGRLAQGFDADLIIVEKTTPYTIDTGKFESQARVSPYQDAGVQLKWKVSEVLVNGELMVERGILVGQPLERPFISRQADPPG